MNEDPTEGTSHFIKGYLRMVPLKEVFLIDECNPSVSRQLEQSMEILA